MNKICPLCKKVVGMPKDFEKFKGVMESDIETNEIIFYHKKCYAKKYPDSKIPYL